MARDSEYQFIVTDVSELEAVITEAYERITGNSLLPASREKLFVKWVTNIITHERVLNNYTGNQNIPSRAEGENLDALGELLYEVERPMAKAAVCTERFYISAPQKTVVLIPKGTRVSDTNGMLVWETTKEDFIPIGAAYVDIPIQCQTEGETGNGFTRGQLSKLIDSYNFADKCENIQITDGGADRADDDEYYELMRDGMDAFSCAGAMGSYIYFAKNVSTEIGDVVANSHAPGCVDIYVLMKDGSFASETMKEEVLKACSADEVRPLTDFVAVHDPNEVNYDIELTFYLQSQLQRTPEDIAANVGIAIQQYIAWQGGKLGRDIDPSELIYRIKQTGVKRVEVKLPVFTALRNGKDGLAPQAAVVNDIRIVNGGIEDE